MESIREVDLSGNLADNVFIEPIESDKYPTLTRLGVRLTDTFTIHHILYDMIFTTGQESKIL
jgi:hypothetical protein